MQALPARWQRAVIGLFITGGNKTAALRLAGYKADNRASIRVTASKIFADARVKAAVLEECGNRLATDAPEMLSLVAGIARDNEARDADRLAAARIYLDRGLPLMTTHRVDVTHRTIDPDQEALEELRAARKLGATRETLIGLYGPNGLDRLEALEVLDDARRADAAKVIEHQSEERHDG